MPKRPRDPNQLAKGIVDIATGEAQDSVSEAKKRPNQAKGRAGGLKGGEARAAILTSARRSAIARKAAKIRWKRSR